MLYLWVNIKKAKVNILFIHIILIGGFFFSLSVLFWEIASRKTPFEDIPTKRLLKMLPERLQAGKGPGEIEIDTPPKFKNIIDRCGSLEQENRPEIKQVSKELNSLYLSYGNRRIGNT